MRDIGESELVPQGGGDPRTGHRCPGEQITVAVLAALAVRLVRLAAASRPRAATSASPCGHLGCLPSDPMSTSTEVSVWTCPNCRQVTSEPRKRCRDCGTSRY